MSKEPSSSVCKVYLRQGLEGGCAYIVEGRKDDTLDDVKKIPETLYCFILYCPVLLQFCPVLSFYNFGPIL